MSKIIIKGVREPFDVNRSVAERIKRSWLDENTDQKTKIDIGDFTTTFCEIKSIDLRGEPVIDKSNKVFDDTFSKETEVRREFLLRTIDQKANDLGFFRFIYRAVIGQRDMTIEAENEAIELQRKFFTENPTRTKIDIVATRVMLRKYLPKGRRTMNGFESSAFRIAGLVVSQDRLE